LNQTFALELQVETAMKAARFVRDLRIAHYRKSPPLQERISFSAVVCPLPRSIHVALE